MSEAYIAWTLSYYNATNFLVNDFKGLSRVIDAFFEIGAGFEVDTMLLRY